MNTIRDTLKTTQLHSVVTMNLTINNSTTNSDSLVTCDSNGNGNIYTTTYSIQQTIDGCDSIVTIV